MDGPVVSSLVMADKEEEEEVVFHFRDQEQISSLLLHLNRLRKEQVLTDVLLCSDNTEIPCHRNVLVSSSPYFRAMFCNDFVETNQSRVNLKGITASILSSIVDYVYTGRICITMETVLPLMQAASMLQYVRLFEACSTFLQEGLSPDNCLSMLRLSEILSCGSLGTKAKQMAVERFSRVSASEDLCELSLAELLVYLEDDGLCAEEEQVFQTLLTWIRHDPLSRRGAVGDLFRTVRLRYVHPTFLFQFVAGDPLIRSSPLCTEIIESARRLLFSAGADPALAPDALWEAPRRAASRQTLVVVGGRKNNEQTSREALLFDEKTQKWQGLAKLPVRLYKPSYGCLHSILYVLGGLTMNTKHSQVSSAVYTFSLKTNQWRTAEAMPTARYAHQSVSHLHFLFALGGVGADGRACGAVERYDSMFSQWERVAPMPQAVLHPAVAAVGRRLYVFGGEDAWQNPVRVVQVYHISRNLWYTMENRTVKNISAPAVVIDDRIYIIGGYTRRVIAYDTKTNRFVKCTDLKERRMHHAAAALDGRIYVTGGRSVNGHDEVEDRDGVERYDPATDTWTPGGTLPFRLFDHGSLALACVSNDIHP